MKPLREWSADSVALVRAVAFDLDDTVLTHGELSLEAYAALHALRDSGLALVAATGRPFDWGAVITRQWPVEACIVENGGLTLVKREGRVERIDALSTGARNAHTERLVQLVSEVKSAFPTLELASDAAGRLTDVSWDVNERVHVEEELVRSLLSFLQSKGAATTRSSVHVHATFEPNTKATGLFSYAQNAWGLSESDAASAIAFIGDSGNDESCFGAFLSSVAVANVRAHLHTMSAHPRYVTAAERGLGFAEFARYMIARRT
jgi:hydroxymethylpyrimidine pyrophosphatase-like HAD family hydrolase